MFPHDNNCGKKIYTVTQRREGKKNYSGDCTNCGNTTEATTLLQPMYQTMMDFMVWLKGCAIFVLFLCYFLLFWGRQPHKMTDFRLSKLFGGFLPDGCCVTVYMCTRERERERGGSHSKSSTFSFIWRSVGVRLLCTYRQPFVLCSPPLMYVNERGVFFELGSPVFFFCFFYISSIPCLLAFTKKKKKNILF